MNTFLIIAVAVEAVAVILFGAAWLASRRARGVAQACDFPGCIKARAELRRLATEHLVIPREDVLAVVENVEKHEHRP